MRPRSRWTCLACGYVTTDPSQMRQGELWPQHAQPWELARPWALVCPRCGGAVVDATLSRGRELAGTEPRRGPGSA